MAGGVRRLIAASHGGPTCSSAGGLQCSSVLQGQRCHTKQDDNWLGDKRLSNHYCIVMKGSQVNMISRLQSVALMGAMYMIVIVARTMQRIASARFNFARNNGKSCCVTAVIHRSPRRRKKHTWACTVRGVCSRFERGELPVHVGTRTNVTIIVTGCVRTVGGRVGGLVIEKDYSGQSGRLERAPTVALPLLSG
jgi:hypothetical protein